MALAGAAVLLLCLVVVMAIIVGRARPVSGASGSTAASSLGGLAAYRAPEAAAGVFAGLVGTLAAGAVSEPGPWPGAALGALCGVAFAVLAGRSARVVRGAVLGVLGIAGCCAAVVDALRPGCDALPLAVHVLSLVFVAVPAGATILASALTGRLRLRSALAVFGVVEIIAFLSTPFGVSLVGAAAPAWIVVCVTAAVLGAAAGIAPDLVIGLTGLALAASSAIVAATVGGSCAGGAGRFTMLVGYAVVYALLRPVTRRLLP